jgi:FtsH-binding integral membrane protein
MDTAYRLFMYIFPFAVSMAVYIWLFRRALRVPNKPAKTIALLVITAGVGYTFYRIAITITTALIDENFHASPIIVSIIVGFFAAIAMALGEPEK